MSDLTVPKDWIKVNIAEIADVDLGKTPKKKDYKNDGFYKVIKFRDVGYEGIDWSKNKDGFVPKDATKDLRKLEKHDVLITASAHSSEHIGRKICFVNRIPNDYKDIFYCGELLGIRADKDALNPKFVFLYFLSHDGYKEVQSHVKGVHLTSGQARNMIIPFAAYEEQKEVISIIEEVFSDLDNAIDNFKKAKDQFKIYRQAVLKQAFEGKLIGSKVKWGNVSLGNLGEWNGGGTPSKSKKEYWLRGKIPWVSPKDMKADEIIDTQDHITESAIENSSAKMIEKHSILIVVRSGILRHSFPVAITNMKCAVNQDLKALKPFSNVFFKYVLWILKAYGSDILHKCSKKGTTVQSIEFPIFKNYKIPIPEDIEEQKEIVREIEARFSVCDKMEETINNSLKQAEALRQSILKQAFEGRLTEDWRKKHPDLIRGENSAKALLDRIKKEREALKNTKKRKK